MKHLCKKLTIITVLMFSLSLTSCGNKTDVAEEVIEETEDSVVNYKTGQKWFLHNVNNMDIETVQYYAIKQLYITKAERLILEDFYISGGELDKEITTMEDFLSSANTSSDIYKFYDAMKTSEEDLSEFTFNYLKSKYPESISENNSEEFYRIIAKNFFSDINQFDINERLRDEVVEFLSSFKMTDMDWLTYDIKDKYINHFEVLKQFVPSDYDIVKDEGFLVLAKNKTNPKKFLTIIQDPITGEVYSIDVKTGITDLNSYYKFNITDYLPKDNEEEQIGEVWDDTIENRESEDGIVYTDVTASAEIKELDEEVMNAWSKNFTIREDTVKPDKIDAAKLISNGYIYKYGEDDVVMLVKTDNTGKIHTIIITEDVKE